MTWQTKTLGEVCDAGGGIIKTGPFGSQLHESDYVDEGLPVVMPKDILEGRVVTDSIAQIDEETAQRLNQHALKPGDIVYGRRGDIGRQALITERERGWLCGTGCLRVTLGKITDLDSQFLHYYLRDAEVISWISNQAVGATMPNLNTSILRSVPVKFPPLPTQRKIAAILSAYDDLIENNTRRVRMLEQMARALYREWFVEYRYPGHEQAQWVEDEAGRRPKGWEIIPFEEVLAFAIGGGWGKEEPDDKHVESGYVIRGTDIPDVRHGGTGAAPRRFHAASNIRSRRLKVGDIVFEVSGGSKGQPVGRAALMTETLLGNFDDDVICASFCKLLRIRTDYPPILIFHILDEWYGNGKIEEYQTQSTGIINFKFEPFLKGAMVVMPPEALRESFAEIAGVWMQAVHSLGQRNANLRQTRDLLLPRLVSGELDVSGLRVAGVEEETEGGEG